jgi:hypothetical protein
LPLTQRALGYDSAGRQRRILHVPQLVDQFERRLVIFLPEKLVTITAQDFLI